MSEPRTTEQINKARVDKVKAFVDTHYGEDLRLVDLAEMVNVAPTTLCHIFKDHTGVRLFDYITGVRIAEAKRKLIETNLGIKAISYGCGFSTLTNFNRHFKNLIGHTPTEYREMNRKS